MTDLKLGRKAPSNAPALRLATLLSGVMPAHPLAADHINFGGWDMLGNDQYGDCVSVTRSNAKRLVSRLAGSEVYYDLDETIAFYKTQNPGFPAQDDGMVMQDALGEMLKRGEIIAFAKVDHTDPDEVAAAIAIFGGIWVGVDVTDANMQQFYQGRPWDYVRGSRNDGGHCILYGAYNQTTGGNEGFVTWGEETFSTDAFWSNQVEEAWVVVFPENLGTPQFQQGIDLDQLKAAYQAITGRTLPVPSPKPTPVPTPDPGAATFHLSTAVAARVAALAARAKLTPDAWLERHLRNEYRVQG